ncbi:tyrosine-protein phosphatase [Clostridium formicaceticum]|uniref:protein-tyrosine-phosphatase n=1 Tax=Clostridium formicaceticum TaxID=1497 RepID=A0AAC9WEM6_9CLOT|nr:CpsB/CapC family capsule biosynthesis tyrosine phosphatase [Clostridium formicaceticum]AOY75599.1 hypothetical protein BJL90_06650 [Clostridium formicaceticum]ARE85906.1 Tyrosine-protein phosphatase YwqE [Clostridium formicaceticum]
MVDLHSHILPEIDDGAKNLEEALKMAEIAVKEGITQMVATPHYIPEVFTTDAKTLLMKIEEINAFLKEKGLALEILSGNEAYLSLDLPQRLKNQEILSINKGPYVLLELPMADIPNYTEDVLYEMRLLGYKPIIAHPERYGKIIENPNLLKEWIEQGNYAQINTMSITGALGKEIQETAKILLKHGMIHCIGTDAHSPRGRAPKIKKALHIMEGWIGKDKTDMLLENNEKIIKGQEIIITQPKAYREKKGMFYYIYRWFFHRYKKAYQK